jgi:P4 family phage/plasmid primase-like protien
LDTGGGYDPEQVRQWLRLLHGHADGLTHICCTGDWAGATFTDLDQATNHVTGWHRQGREGIYVRVTTLKAPLAPGRRGGAADTASLPALWADLDLAGPGHQHDPAQHGGHDLPPDEAAARMLLAASGLPVPTLWVHSGGGLYPIWLLDQPAAVDDRNRSQIAQLAALWQHVIATAAERAGWHYGTGVGDLARVLRIPGTVNRKAGLARPCRILDRTGPRHTLRQLHDALTAGLRTLPAASPPPASHAVTLTPAGPAGPRSDSDPGEDLNRRGSWPQILQPAGWSLAYERDAVQFWTRPGKTTGVSATVNALGTDRLYCFTTNGAPFLAGQSYNKHAAYTLLNHGGDFRTATRELARAGYGGPLPDAQRQAQDNMAVILGNPESPAPPVATGRGPASRYFTDGGALLAQVLADDVITVGPLAVGGDDILWTYRGGVWNPARYVVRDRLTELLGDRYRRTHAAHVEDIVRARSWLITCDPITDVVNFRNGLLDWRTRTLTGHTPDVLTTVQLSVDWTPQATCGRFEKFLAEVVPADMTSVMWEMIGYLMLSGNPLHKAIMLMGTGRNGKGTLLRAIVGLLGKHNVTAVSLQDLTATRFATVTLFGKLANIAGDIDATYLDSTSNFKAITGQDQISAEHKGRDRFDFTPWAVPVFSANEIPASADTSVGYLSRWLPIPFPHSFVGKEDRTLDMQLADELPGIAARAIPALQALMERGEFERPPSALAALAEFARRVDQVRSWIEDCCEPVPPQPHDPAAVPFVSRTSIYEAYRRWCGRDGHRALAAAKFYDRLEGAGATRAKVRGERGFRGIIITDSATLLTQSQQGHWWLTESDKTVDQGGRWGAGGGQLHNVNLPPLKTGGEQGGKSVDQGRGAEGASPILENASRAHTRTRTREIAGNRENLPHLPPPAPLINCTVCGKSIDIAIHSRWHIRQLHPSCAPEDLP